MEYLQSELNTVSPSLFFALKWPLYLPTIPLMDSQGFPCSA